MITIIAIPRISSPTIVHGARIAGVGRSSKTNASAANSSAVWKIEIYFVLETPENKEIPVGLKDNG